MKETFHDVLTAAVADLAAHGYDNPYRLAEWLKRLRIAAITTLPSDSQMDRKMQMAMETAFKRAIGKSRTTKIHPGVSRFTIQHIEPRLRSELTRRILAGADLIKLNREQAIEKTLQRFSGWASSIPAGGSRAVDKLEVKKHIGKPLQSMPYEERRLHIDQGHKLMSAIDATIAQQTGAIAAVWHSHWRQAGYDYREDHKERDQKIYAIRGSWAFEQGLVNKGDGYLDEITQPAEEPFCRCFATYISIMRDIPERMLTAKGKRLLEEVRLKRA